jgi:hypothetical protein
MHPGVVGPIRPVNPLVVSTGLYLMSTHSPTRCTLVVLGMALAVLAVVAADASAADIGNALPAVLPAWQLIDVVHDRARLIQCSIGAVVLGIALLWWGNKTH